jgi:CDP-diacylglycerol--glycerol-3-phosphate 3-phosphatidyltransferase
MVVIIVGRELAVTGLRSIASTEGFALRPSELGKTKMVFQVVAIAVIILQRRYPAIEPLGTVLLWMVVMFAVASALQYFWLFWKQQDLRVKQRAARPLVMVRTDEKEPEEKDVAAH